MARKPSKLLQMINYKDYSSVTDERLMNEEQFNFFLAIRPTKEQLEKADEQYGKLIYDNKKAVFAPVFIEIVARLKAIFPDANKFHIIADFFIIKHALLTKLGLLK